MDYLAARLVDGKLTGTPVEQAVDLGRIEKAVREILIAIGEDPDRDGLERPPARVARAYAELFAGLRVDPAKVLTTTFEANHEELAGPRHLAEEHGRAPLAPVQGCRPHRLHPRPARPDHRPVEAGPPGRGLRPPASSAGAT